MAPVALVQAADFTVTNGVTDTAQKTLNAGETGTIDAGGTLSTTATSITATGAGATVTNNGTLTTTTGSLVNSSGTNVTVTNNGTATGGNSDVFFSSGANFTLTNNGTLTTTTGNLVNSSGTNFTLTNTGTATGATATAFISSGANSSLTNTGTISTSTSADAGIDSNGADSSLTNTGTILTTGNLSDGLRATGARSIISNSGTISTTGNFADGIESGGANVMITNSGTITTTGSSADGIQSTGADATITHSGAITVSGTSAVGLLADAGGVTTTFNVSGSITATGSATQAIVGRNGNETLNIQPGATIVGTIDLGAGTNAVNVFTDSGARSSTLTISNAGTVNAAGGDGIVVQNGNTVAIVDPTNLSAGRVTLGAVTSGIHQAVGQQLARSDRPGDIELASASLEPGMLYQPRAPFAWGQVFGGRKTRGDDGSVLAYKNNIFGAVGGYEAAVDDHSIGALGGVSRSTLKTNTDSIETKSMGAFIGGYGEYVIGNWALTGTLIAGYDRHDSERLVVDNLNGDEIAQSDYDTFYLSPSAGLIRTIPLASGMTLRPSAELNYTVGYNTGYTESETTSSNLTVEDHTTDVVGSRLQLAVRKTTLGGKGEVELRAGATYSYFGRDDVNIRLGNGPVFRHKGAGKTYSRGGYVGTNARFDMTERVSVVADAEYGFTDRDEKTILGSLKLEFRF